MRLIAGIAAAIALLAATAAGAQRPLQRVTFFGDSVAASLDFDSTAAAIASRSVAMDLELKACRRIVAPSCAIRGAGPPATLLESVAALGSRLAPTVVVAVGYNDSPPEFAPSLHQAVAALEARGAAHVLWLTYREARHPYVEMNAELRAAAQTDKHLVVVDWNAYSRSHPSWFAPDGLHLNRGGAEGLATLVHATLARLGLTGPTAPPLDVVTAALPATVWGAPYSVRLRARGGAGPYRWELSGGDVTGLELSPNGLLAGQARSAPGRHELTVRVVDTSGTSATATLAFVERF